MKTLRYLTGEEISDGDHVLVHGEHGAVEFVLTSETGDPSRDFVLREHPDGGVMLNATGFGAVFFHAETIDEKLQFVSRKKE